MATQAQILSGEMAHACLTGTGPPTPQPSPVFSPINRLAHCPFMQNKPNFQTAQMNLTPVKKTRYENPRLPIPRENKPNRTESQPPRPPEGVNVLSRITQLALDRTRCPRRPFHPSRGPLHAPRAGRNQIENSRFRVFIWAFSRATIDECICETRDSDKSRVAPISFIVISS